MKPNNTVLTIWIILAIILLTISYKIKRHNDIRKPQTEPVAYVDKRGKDKLIARFGKQKFAYYSGGMSSSISFKDPKKYEGDDYSKFYFDVIIDSNWNPRLYNLHFDPKSIKLVKGDIVVTTRLEASTWYQNGKQITDRYKEALNSTYWYSVRKGEQYGLEKYVMYRKEDNQRPAALDEYLVTMEDDGTPLRLLRVTHSPEFGETAGGVYHYFMYNDLVQVKIHYQKFYLKHWQRIENVMRAYIDQLYAEAKP